MISRFEALLSTLLVICVAQGSVSVLALQTNSNRLPRQRPALSAPTRVYAPLWFIDSSTDSEIEIANLADAPKMILLSFRDNTGREIMRSIELSPFETFHTSAKSLVAWSRANRVDETVSQRRRRGPLDNEHMLWGNAAIETSDPTNLAAKIRVQNLLRNESFEVPFANPKQNWSKELVSALWLPPSMRGFLVVRNLAPTALELEITAHAQGRSTTVRKELAGQEQEEYDLEELFPAVQLGDMEMPIGLRVHHDGENGDLLAWGLLADDESQPQSVFPFLDTAKRFGNLVYHPAVVFESPAMATVSDATPLRPYLLVYNSGKLGSMIRARSSISEESKDHLQWETGPMDLPGRSVVAIDLLQYPGSSSGLGSVVLEHEAAADVISAWLIHLDARGRIAMRDKMVDPISEVSNGVYAAEVPFSDTTTAVAAVRNITGQRIELHLQVWYDSPSDGIVRHRVPLKPLEAYESMVFDLGRTSRLRKSLPSEIEPSAHASIVSSRANSIVAAFLRIESGHRLQALATRYYRDASGGGIDSPSASLTKPAISPRDFFCTGTTSCQYYDDRCAELSIIYPGKAYYCGPGKFACENIGVVFDVVGLSGVENCIRKCLQVSDGCVYILDPPQFSACINVLHAFCYTDCANPLCYLTGGGGNEDECFIEQCADGYIWSVLDCACVPENPSPILISERGNQLQLTNASQGVNFDLDLDGTAERTSWTRSGSQAAFLALDRNGNGKIDDGSELFGDRSPQPPTADPNGFEALAVFDQPANGGNSDGRITAADSIFDQLILWRDTNHDGQSQVNEMRFLHQHGVAALQLGYRESRRKDLYGNRFRYFSRVVMERSPGEPATLLAVDVFFVGLPDR